MLCVVCCIYPCLYRNSLIVHNHNTRAAKNYFWLPWYCDHEHFCSHQTRCPWIGYTNRWYIWNLHSSVIFHGPVNLSSFVAWANRTLVLHGGACIINSSLFINIAKTIKRQYSSTTLKIFLIWVQQHGIVSHQEWEMREAWHRLKACIWNIILRIVLNHKQTIGLPHACQLLLPSDVYLDCLWGSVRELVYVTLCIRIYSYYVPINTSYLPSIAQEFTYG